MSQRQRNEPEEIIDIRMELLSILASSMPGFGYQNKGSPKIERKCVPDR
jgi:hypothetical protein